MSIFNPLTRRRLFTSIAGGLAGASLGSRRATVAPRQEALPAVKGLLLLSEFEPKSMLHVQETPIERARFPVIDVHTHVTFRAKQTGGVSQGEAINIPAPPG